MYWVTPTLLAILLVTLAFAIAALTTQYTYPLTVTLLVVLVVGIGVAIFGILPPKKTHSFHMNTYRPSTHRMSTSKTFVAPDPTEIPPLPPMEINWPKNLG